MTLNFSRRPIFPPSEDNFVSSMRMREGISTDRFLWNTHHNFDDTHHHHHHHHHDYGNYGRDGERGGSCEPIANDILDLLPSDPFGMNIGATFTAITGWFEDLEMDGLNFIWNNALKFQSEWGTHERWNSPSSSVSSTFGGGCVTVSNADNGSVSSCNADNGSASVCHVDNGFVSVCNADDLSNFCDKYSQDVTYQANELDVGSCSNSNGGGGDPHEAFFYALGYLDVSQLFCVESVCKSLHFAVQNDPLLWRNIHIDKPLSEKIDDDALFRLTMRAQGNLHSLSLLECSKITDDGLKRVLENNLKLTKLSVPGCTRLSIEGIVNNLKASRSLGALGLTHLRIGGRYGVTQSHYDELKILLGVDDAMQSKSHKPRFYRSGHLSLSNDDDRAIDIEMCPKCENLRLVYDCPAESCREKQSSDLCRACTICIARCDQCGRCINDSEYEETFCLDLLCSDCLKQEEKGTPPRSHSFNQKTLGHLRVYG